MMDITKETALNWHDDMRCPYCRKEPLTVFRVSRIHRHIWSCRKCVIVYNLKVLRKATE